GVLRCAGARRLAGIRLRYGQGAYRLPSSFSFRSGRPPPDYGQHVAERLEWSVNEVLRLAILAKGSFGKDVIDAPGNASIGMTIADQDGRKSSAGVDGARHGALADPALHPTRGVGVRERQRKTIAAEEEVIGEDRNCEAAGAHGAADGMIESVAHDGQ